MLRKRFGKVWERLNQGKRELKGLMGKIRKEEEEEEERRKDGIRTRQGFGELKKFIECKTVKIKHCEV